MAIVTIILPAFGQPGGKLASSYAIEFDFRNVQTLIGTKFTFMVAMGLVLLHIKKTGTVDKVPLSEKFIGNLYTGMVHGGIVTSF